jgi:hypothetical protein
VDRKRKAPEFFELTYMSAQDRLRFSIIEYLQYLIKNRALSEDATESLVKLQCNYDIVSLRMHVSRIVSFILHPTIWSLLRQPRLILRNKFAGGSSAMFNRSLRFEPGRQGMRRSAINKSFISFTRIYYRNAGEKISFSMCFLI